MHDPLFLAIQSTYSSVEIALFCNTLCLGEVTIDKIQATEKTVPELNSILKKHTTSVSDLNFIVANQGPAPFTTLRVVLVTVNGLSFATHVPLIGLDGLEALMLEQGRRDLTTIVLLNAFNHEVYYAIFQETTLMEKGYQTISKLLDKLSRTSYQYPLYFIGNGTQLYKNNIKDALGAYALIPTEPAEYCSIHQVGLMGLNRWKNQEKIATKLLPLYLKD